MLNKLGECSSHPAVLCVSSSRPAPAFAADPPERVHLASSLTQSAGICITSSWSGRRWRRWRWRRPWWRWRRWRWRWDTHLRLELPVRIYKTEVHCTSLTGTTQTLPVLYLSAQSTAATV